MKSVKKIHYIWVGGRKKPALVKKCIRSWEKFFPDWEIIEWNESNLDININEYCKQAYEAKKYAFVSDVLRFDVLYRYGGLYFDTDVEVIKSFETIINEYEAFSGFENEYINPGLVLYSAYPGNSLFKEMLDIYSQEKFALEDGYNTKTVCEYFTELMCNYGLKQNNQLQTINGFTVFPRTFFCPVDSIWRRQEFTKDTYTIHRFAASWVGRKQKLEYLYKRKGYKLLGRNTIDFFKRILGRE